MLASTLDCDGEAGISNNRLIKLLLKAMYDAEPPKPKYTVTWPVQNVLDLFKVWGANEQLSFKRLSFKTAMLLALTTLLRCSELVAIDHRSVVVTETAASFSLSKPRKAQHSGPLCTIRVERFEDALLCPVKCLTDYLDREATLRKTAVNLFLGTIPPRKPIGSSSIGRWLKQTMTESGIDPAVFGAHSTRGAAASRALERGLPIEAVLGAGGWARESTFTCFYQRIPVAQTVSRAILSS